MFVHPKTVVDKTREREMVVAGACLCTPKMVVDRTRGREMVVAASCLCTPTTVVVMLLMMMSFETR